MAFAAAGGGGEAADGAAGAPLAPSSSWPALLAIMFLTTPLQAAGEEYVFRGWIPQLIGALVPGPRMSALLAGAISSTLFALAHGQQDPWMFADSFLLGAVAFWLAWRTGGLEAGIALHVVKNLVVMAPAVLLGGQTGLDDP